VLPLPSTNCPVPIANCLPSTAKQLTASGTVDIIPMDTVGRTVRHNAQYSGTLTGGLLQQRCIHHPAPIFSKEMFRAGNALQKEIVRIRNMPRVYEKLKPIIDEMTPYSHKQRPEQDQSSGRPRGAAGEADRTVRFRFPDGGLAIGQ